MCHQALTASAERFLHSGIQIILIPWCYSAQIGPVEMTDAICVSRGNSGMWYLMTRTVTSLSSFRPVIFVLDDVEVINRNVSESGEIPQQERKGLNDSAHYGSSVSISTLRMKCFDSSSLYHERWEISPLRDTTHFKAIASFRTNVIGRNDGCGMCQQRG